MVDTKSLCVIVIVRTLDVRIIVLEEFKQRWWIHGPVCVNKMICGLGFVMFDEIVAKLLYSLFTVPMWGIFAALQCPRQHSYAVDVVPPSLQTFLYSSEGCLLPSQTLLMMQILELNVILDDK